MRMLWVRLIFVGLSFFVSQQVVANDLIDAQQMVYQQKLDHEMQLIEQTKQILDDEHSTATPMEQQLALCGRLKAYQNIVGLADQFIQVEQAHVMKRIAQFYLNQQSTSFQQSGMTIDDWCSAN